MKIDIVALTRFHMFDQAIQIKANDELGALITSYPNSDRFLGKYAELRENIHSNVKFAIYMKIIYFLEKLGIGTNCLRHITTKSFARYASSIIKASDSDVVIGLSSQLLEVLQDKKEGVTYIVDHGSLHEKYEAEILSRECQENGYSVFGNWSRDWLIERQTKEFELADFVFCCSDYAKETLVRFGVEPQKIVVNQLGVDLSEFYFNSGSCDTNESKFNLLYVGGVNPRKGLRYLFDAYQLVLEKYPTVTLDIAGGLSADKRFNKWFEEVVSTHTGITYHGSLKQRDLRTLYEKANLFVLPSLADGWGMVTLQALACGNFVITTSNVGSKECLQEGKTGLIIDAGNSIQLGEEITRYIDSWNLLDSERREIRKVYCRDSVRDRYTWKAYGARLREFLSRLGL